MFFTFGGIVQAGADCCVQHGEEEELQHREGLPYIHWPQGSSGRGGGGLHSWQLGRPKWRGGNSTAAL